MNRGVALPNSFFLNFTNNSSEDTVLSLFNLGENASEITHQQVLNTLLNLDLSAFVDPTGKLNFNTTIKVEDSASNVIATSILTGGLNLYTALPPAINPITDLQGNTGVLAISRIQSSAQFANIAISRVNASKITFVQGINTQVGLFSQSIASFAKDNPLITIGGTIPYYEIKQSETGNVYKVIATDFYSPNSQQIIEPFMYGYKLADGNRAKTFSTPIIDVYQPLGISIQNLRTDGLLLYSTTIFEYKILAYSFVRMTFNYVKANLTNLIEFEQAFDSELLYETEKMRNELLFDNGRQYILLQ